MELGHMSALVHMVQSERAEDVANSKLYMVKAKRGIVTFTKCDGEVARSKSGVRVSGRNLDPVKLVSILFEGRKPIPELQKDRMAVDVTKEERAKILEGEANYPLPEGVFFNGSKYINWEGETLKQHPCMDEMIDDYLELERKGLSTSIYLAEIAVANSLSIFVSPPSCIMHCRQSRWS